MGTVGGFGYKMLLRLRLPSASCFELSLGKERERKFEGFKVGRKGEGVDSKV